MKQIALYIGGIALVIGTLLPLILPAIAPYVFALGVLFFVPAQVADRYDGRNLMIRRLRRQQLVGCLALIATAGMMFMELWQIKPCRGGEWKIMLLIAVIFEVYTIFRIDAEVKKEK